MRIALGYKSSTPIWRTCTPNTSTLKWRSRITSLDGFTCSNAVEALNALCEAAMISPPVELLVNDLKERHATSVSSARLWSSALAGNSLYPLASIQGYAHIPNSEQIYVSSPEFCLLQAAATHSLPQIILYGMEACGTFSLPIRAGGDLVPRVPLTSARRISAYINRCEGSRGYRGAASALPYILDGSASPMESKLAMKLVLPKRLGGMGFHAPVLNYELPLDLLPAELAGKGKFRFDLYWPDFNLVVEYDSEQEHTGRARIAKDSVRRNVIDYLGLNLVTVTPDQLMHEESFALVALEIAHHMHLRLRSLSPTTRKARRELNRQLFPWRYR